MDKSILTKWKCGECKRWFNQKVRPEGMNKVSCNCGNSGWFYISLEDAKKIEVKESK